MARPKKDGVYINCFIERQLMEKLREYAARKGQTMTMALERILQEHLGTTEQEAKDEKI